ncbi:hypothetical protein FHG66_11435 [Rubellimicrobium rubrum]|uniref:Uncharacterized protein n=1 Tax=Rubellimicrobium rubrum TaxID=2585369 RepID=A0A5C4MUR0_9RHOB|nr:hypothetical protein [Rubellimicrobium rubrum]TNC49336.1 hypothetical protein FHG66_11435 [Rubellimicrobium rubrum]
MLDAAAQGFRQDVSVGGGPAPVTRTRIWGREDLRAERNLWIARKIGLKVLSDRIWQRTAATGSAVARDPIIEQLLTEPAEGERPDFLRLYEAEQRLALLMDDSEIRAEAVGRFAKAQQLAIPTYTELKTAFYKDRTDEEGRRVIYSVLLRDLHAAYQSQEHARYHRAKAARRLNAWGFALIAPGVVVLVLCYWLGQLGQLGPYHVLAVMWCGVSGAFLSRMILFQKVMATIGVEEITTDFSHFAIVLRLIVGVLGALVMYFLIVGEVVDGDFFPDWNGDADIWQRYDAGARKFPWQEPGFNIVSAPFAQLLIWSTLAGFSERIIPDRFARMEVAVSQSRR